MHLSYDDFCRLTREEFDVACKMFRNRQESRSRDDWERMRLLATICIQPHVKNKITPSKLIPFPWDRKKSGNGDNLTMEERQERMAEAIKKLGEKY